MDVPEHARSSAVAAQAEERLQNIIDAMDAGTWQWDLRSDECTFNARWAETFGYEPQELASRFDTYRQMLHPDDLADAEASLKAFLASDNATYRHSERMRHRDGHWVWVQQRGRLIERHDDGAPAIMVGVTLDESDTRAVQEQLRRSSIYARSLLEASVDPLATIGVDGRIMDVNRATENATGIAREELIGSDFSDYFTEPERARAGYQQVFTLGRVIDYPLTLQHRSGELMDVLYNASTYHDEEGRVAGVFAAARNVTEIRRSQRELEQTNHEVMLLSQMSDLLQSCQTIDEAMPILRASMGELFPTSRGRVFVADAESHQLDEVVSWGLDGEAALTLNPGECWALRRSSIHEVSDEAPLNPPCHAVNDADRPYLCIPLLAQGHSLGVIHLLIGAELQPRERTHRLARATADSMSLALANIRLRENLQSLSTRDPLTGLYNRRFLEDALARELARAGRSRQHGVVALMDIDHFKNYNDTFGHDAGDAVLVKLAEHLKGFRTTDLPCRYGGEEFLLVLTELDVAQARERLEELRADVAAERVVFNGKELPGITISIGVAPFPSAGKDVAATIRSADEALYRAKQAGRDRIETSEAAV